MVKAIAVPHTHQAGIKVHIWTFILGAIWVFVAGFQILVASRQIVPLNATLLDNSATSETEPVQLTSQTNELDEQRLIKALMQTDFKVDYDGFPKRGSWRSVRMRVTGYCACQKCCGSYSDGVTASNHTIVAGDAFVAADKSYAFGTEMIIPGYHKSLPIQVLDRGGAIKGDRLDAFFHTHEEALQWGIRDLNVLLKIN